MRRRYRRRGTMTAPMMASGGGVADGMVKLDGYALRPIGPADFDVVRPVLERVPAEVFAVPRVEDGYRHFIGRLSQLPWTLPMACLDRGQAAGVCFLSVPQLRHLGAYLVPLFVEPAGAAAALALYVRHAFWTFPLHRLYTHLPRVDAARPYAELLSQAGFVSEGSLIAHGMNRGAPVDVMAFGLLRDEFSTWCAVRDPRLSL